MFAQIKATSCRHHKKRGGGGGWAGVWGVGVRDVVAQKQLRKLLVVRFVRGVPVGISVQFLPCLHSVCSDADKQLQL